jgi:GTPase involved in cell partitioning and DNA repair
LQQELADFDHTLLDRPSFVVITKIDTITQRDLKKLSNQFGGGYLWLSAVTGMGAEKFLLEVERQLDQQRIERTPG